MVQHAIMIIDRQGFMFVEVSSLALRFREVQELVMRLDYDA